MTSSGRKLSLLSLCFCCFFFAVEILAEEDMDIKVGTVNLEMVIRNSLSYKAADLEWSRILSQKQVEIENKKQEIDSLKADLNNLEPGNNSERNKIELNLEQMKVDLKYLVKSHKKDLSLKERKFFEQISSELEIIISDYGKKQGYDFIINESSIFVIHINVALDITGEILTEYNNYWESKQNQSKQKTEKK